jgi:hypothetical protein
MADETEAPPNPPMPLGPIPTIWSCVHGEDPERKMTWVILQLQTPQGTSTFFFDASGAQKLGQAILKNARQADTYDRAIHKKLIVPSNGMEVT